MTTFPRKNLVNPGYHTVTRSVWHKSSWASLSLNERGDWLIKYIRAHDLEELKSLLVPNATCPECADEVYFFKHYNGGCAWFDDIPYPWPKHRCMDIEGTRCSSEFIAEQDEIETKKQAKERRKHDAKVRVETIETEPFANRFFTPVFCKDCNQNEYEFELSDSTVRRFIDIGCSWKQSDCTITSDNQHRVAENAKYLADFLTKGGKWKSQVPTKINRAVEMYGQETKTSTFLLSGKNIFSVGEEGNAFAIPVQVVSSKRCGDLSMLILLSSVVSGNQHILIKTKRSSILKNAKLAFLRGVEGKPESYNVSYLCLDSGKAKRIDFQSLTYVTRQQIYELEWSPTPDKECLEKLFEMYAENTTEVNPQ